ncbi:MAG: helix-turn-helix domain-containing protein [Thermodesulfobacteriota bacterium]
MPKRLYSLPEAAHYLGRTLWSMRELVWKGSIPIVREGKRIFVDVSDLDSYISKNKTTYI